MYLSESQMEKWGPVLDHPELPQIKDAHRRNVTAVVLENQEKALREEKQAIFESNKTVANADNYDPVLISLVRRALPNLMAYDVCGVQPMTGPTGLIFAMHSKYATTAGDVSAGDEAFLDTIDPKFSGDTTNGDGVDLNNAEGMGMKEVVDTSTSAAGTPVTVGGTPIQEMSFAIDKVTVSAKSRALKAEYSSELAQDLKAIHGLDAETELANILSAEILAEINREVIRTINSQAKTGAQQANVTSNGIFNMSSDTDGRWSAEKFKGLGVQIDRECNVIAKETRRGKGNVIICSSDVATALAAAGTLDYSPAISNNLQVDDTGNTFAGLLNGRIRVYIDPYANTDYVTVGYKGQNPYDSGVFYCPYVPLQMVKAVGEDDFQPRIGFKTRYGMASNPFVGSTPSDGLATAKTNQYYRIFKVTNILT